MASAGYRPSSVDLSSADQTADTENPTRLKGASITTSPSAAVSLKDGSSGSTLAKIPANPVVGAWFEFGDMYFENGIYVDAGGSATGVITLDRKQFINENT